MSVIDMLISGNKTRMIRIDNIVLWKKEYPNIPIYLDGMSWFNMKFIPNKTTRIWGTCYPNMPPLNGTAVWLFGTRYGYLNKSYGLALQRLTSYDMLYARYSNVEWRNASNVFMPAGANNKLTTFEFSYSGGKWNDVSFVFPEGIDLQTDLELYFGNINQASAPHGSDTEYKGTILEMYVEHEGQLIRHYVGCKVGDVYGFLDTIENTFNGSQGTSPFKAGNEEGGELI